MRRFIAMVMLALFCLGLPLVAQASDIDEHWAKPFIEELNASQVMIGDKSGAFRPDDFVTRAEFAVLINRAFGFTADKGITFADVGSSDWFARDISIAASQGYLQGIGSGMAAPTAHITREQAAVMIGKVLRLKPELASIGFDDEEQVSPWARDMVAATARAGYIIGSHGLFRPTDSITRAEAATIIARAAGRIYNKEGVFDGGNQAVKGNVTIATAGVTLKNLVIEGNLYITEGVGDGNVTLEKVTVTGNTLVSGGGVDSVVIIDTDLGTVEIEVPDGSPVRFAARGSSSVSSILVMTDAILDTTGSEECIETTIIALPEGASVTMKGDFSTVEIENPGCTVTVDEGTIDQLIIASTATGAALELEGRARVDSLICDAPATIEGRGRIHSAIINVNNVSLEQKPDNLTIPKGVSVEINSKPVTGSYSERRRSGGQSGSTTTYTLSLSSDPPATAILTGGGNFKEGDSAAVEASPLPGWSFRNWTVDDRIVGTTPRLVYVMPDRDVNLVANLVRNYTLTVLSEPAGGGTVTGAGDYMAGSVFTLTATAKEGYEFDHWTVDGKVTSVEECFTYGMPYSDCTITAHFLPINTRNEWDGTIANVVPQTIEGTYLISTGAQLAWVAERVNKGDDMEDKKFTLQRNIDLKGIPWEPIGGTFPFNGRFNGNKKTIFNLNVSQTTSSDDAALAGLFGFIGSKGRVEKLNVIDANVEAALPSPDNDEQSFNYAGVIAGVNYGSISKCTVSGQVTARDGDNNFAGGLVGWNGVGQIKESYNQAEVTTIGDSAAGGIAGENYGTIEKCYNVGFIHANGDEQASAGGITGLTLGCSIKNCFNTGNVQAEAEKMALAGGIVGDFDAYSSIESCYNTGELIADASGEGSKLEAAGGLLGNLAGSKTDKIKSCYFMAASGLEGIGKPASSPAGKATALSSNAMRNEGSFAGFDFKKDWYFQPSGGYPYPHLQAFSNSYRLTVKAAPSTDKAKGGTAIVDNNAGNKFQPGALVPLKATANPGFSFINWTVNGMTVSEKEEFLYMMPDRNTTVIANFAADAPDLYALNLVADPLYGGVTTGAGVYKAGDQVTLKAVPLDDCAFLQWVRITEDEPEVLGTGPVMAFVMPAEDTFIAAQFSTPHANEYLLTYGALPGGSGKIKHLKSNFSDEFLAGMKVQLAAIPEPGYAFINWTIDGEEAGSSPVLEFIMPEHDVQVVGNFGRLRTLTVEADNPDMGTACIAGGESNATVAAGSMIEIEATPGDGYVFLYWTVDGDIVPGSDRFFSLRMPDADTTIVAHFIAYNPDMEFKLTLQSSDESKGRVIRGSGEYPAGEYVGIEAAANPGYRLLNWTDDDGNVIAEEADAWFTMPPRDLNLTANFQPCEPVEGQTVKDIFISGSQIYDYAYGNGIYIGVGEGGSVIRSTDNGKTWEQAWSGVWANAVAFGNGRFVAIDNENIAYSEDGIEWTKADSSGLSGFLDIAYGNLDVGGGRFIIARGGYSPIASQDGRQWSVIKGVTGGQAIAFGNSRFVIVGKGNTCFSSTDGHTWHSFSINDGGDMDWIDIAYGNGMMNVIGIDYASSKTLFAELPDNAEEWTVSHIPGRLYQSISFANGTFIVTSTEGAYTNTIRLYSDTKNGRYVRDYTGVYEIGGAAGELLFIQEARNDLLVSSDGGDSWKVAVTANPYGFRDIIYAGEGHYVAVGTRDYSTHDFPVAYGGTIIVCNKDKDTFIAYEVLPFDNSMLQRDFRATGCINSVAYGDGKYVAVGGLVYQQNYMNDDDFRSYVYISEDAAEWTLVEQHFPYMLTDVVYVGDRFLAKGMTEKIEYDDEPVSEVVLTSNDGRNWMVDEDEVYPPDSDVVDMDIAEKFGCLKNARAVKVNVDGREEIWVVGDDVIFFIDEE